MSAGGKARNVVSRAGAATVMKEQTDDEETDARTPKTVFDIDRLGRSVDENSLCVPVFFFSLSLTHSHCLSLSVGKKRGPTVGSVGFIFQDTFKRGKQLVAAGAAAHSKIQRE